MTTHMRPYWTARLADARKPTLPPLRGELRVDAAIVGGGLVGCTAAFVFAAGGARVALLEAHRLGAQGTATAPGVILPEPAVPLVTLEAAYGRRASRAMWEMTRHAALEFAALLRRLGVRAELDPVEFAHYLPEREAPRALEREASLRREMGIEGQWLPASRAAATLRASVSGAVKVKAGAVFDPYRACLGLARAARARRAKIFERSPVLKIAPEGGRGRDAEQVRITTAHGSVVASRVIIATGGPTRLFQPLARRFNALLGYRVLTEPLPAALRRRVSTASAVLREATCPGHLLRWTRDNRLLFSGAERLRLPDRSRPAALVQHSAQLMYELSLLYPDLSGTRADYAWDAPFSASDDGLPYIGPHRHYPRHLFALGAGRSDGGSALLAARILQRHYQDKVEKQDLLWGFGR